MHARPLGAGVVDEDVVRHEGQGAWHQGNAGTVRLRHWRAGEVPEHDFEELSMDRIPEIAARHTAEIGRLMVRRSVRGKMLVASMVRASYELSLIHI